MPDTPTSRLKLYKSLSDGSEDVNYTQDIGQNWDKIDAAIGALACTSSTRPSAPYNGQFIRETDTGRLWVSNGSSPASGSWSEITTPGTAQTFTGALTLSGQSMVIERTTAASNAYRARQTGDSSSRFLINADGSMVWGTGATTGDTNLYRSATDTLKTDDSLVVAGSLTVAGVGQVQFVRKTADETVTSSATPQNDDHLFLPVAANAVYLVEVVLMSLDAGDFVGDITTAFAYPTGTTAHVTGAGPHNTDLSAGSNSNTEWIARQGQTGTSSTATPYGAGTITTGLVIKAQIATGGTAGTLQLQWAQNVSNATGTTVKAGSWMRMERVA